MQPNLKDNFLWKFVYTGFSLLGQWGEFPLPPKNLLIPPSPGKIPLSVYYPTKFLFPLPPKVNPPAK